MAGDGSARDRVTEGEPVTIEVWLYAEDGVEGARVTVGFRDTAGQPLGSQTAEGVRLRPARLAPGTRLASTNCTCRLKMNRMLASVRAMSASAFPI